MRAPGTSGPNSPSASSYLEGNERSGRMQRAVGFVEWGRLPEDVWQGGAYRAQIFTMLTRERWEALRGSENPLVS